MRASKEQCLYNTTRLIQPGYQHSRILHILQILGIRPPSLHARSLQHRNPTDFRKQKGTEYGRQDTEVLPSFEHVTRSDVETGPHQDFAEVVRVTRDGPQAGADEFALESETYINVVFF